MRVLFDGFWLPDGPPSGRAVVTGLARGWAAAFPEDDLHLAARGGASGLPDGTTIHRLKSPLHPLANYFEIARLARQLEADAVFTHNFVASGSVPAFTFVHDVLFQSNPEWFSRTERLYFLPIVMGFNNAQVLLTSSDSERRRIKLYNPSVPDVRAVGLAPAPGLDVESTRPNQSLPEPFLLSVGRLNKRKNLRRVLDAHARARESTEQLSALVVVGADSGENMASLAKEWPSVIFLGGVSDGELRWLYENARGLVFASLDEGFGLPPVEALAFGCPVAVSDIDVMREVVQGDGIYFNPSDVSEISAAMIELDSKGRVHPRRRFGWDLVAANVREVMRECL